MAKYFPAGYLIDLSTHPAGEIKSEFYLEDTFQTYLA